MLLECKDMQKGASAAVQSSSFVFVTDLRWHPRPVRIAADGIEL